MGTKTFSIVHDGAGYSRIEKVRRVSTHAIATRSLRVCWRDKSYCLNCGTCEKCVLTQLEFLALGYSNVDCFSRPLDIQLIENVTPGSPNRLRGYEWVLEASKDFCDQPWRAALERRVLALRRKQELNVLRKSLLHLFGRAER